MRKKLIVLAFTGALSQPALSAGIPVIDVASLTQQITQVGHMISQIQEMQKQLQTAENQLNNISGSRGLGGVIDTSYDAAVSIMENEILSEHGIKSADEMDVNPAFRNIYDDRNKDAAQGLGRSQKTLNQSKERYSELNRLIAKVDDSPDQKDVLDLIARIQGESAMLQNELIKLEAMKAEAAAKDAIYQRQLTELRVSSAGTNDKDYTSSFD